MRIYKRRILSLITLICAVRFTPFCCGQYQLATEIHKCCEYQFSWTGDSCQENSLQENKNFPQYLFGKYRLIELNPNNWRIRERIFLPLESLKVTDLGYFLHGQTYIPPSQFCLNRVGPTLVEVILGTSSSPATKPYKLNKCCQMDYSYDVEKRKCFRSHVPWGRLTKNSSVGRENISVRTPMLISNNIPSCKVLLNFTNINYWDRPVRYGFDFGQATLKYESQNGVFLRGIWKTLKEDNFCIDQLQGDDNLLINQNNPTQPRNSDTEPEIVFYCADGDSVSTHYYAVILGCLWIFTAVLLTIAAVVNVCLVQRNVHGYVLFGYLLTSAILNVVAGVFILSADDGRLGCHFIDFVQKFFYLSTLCWMTMVNFDLWWDFRKLEPNAKKSMKRLPSYVFGAWAVPIVIITVCWIVGSKRRSSRDLTHCILYDFGIIIYSSGPVILLNIINVILFIRTTFLIQGLRKATRKVLRHSRRQRESFKLFSKLFLMTGPIWLLRVILLALQIQGNYLSWYGVLIEGVFVIPDITLFFIVVCNRQVIDRLRIHIPWLKEIMCCCRQTLPVHHRNISSSIKSLPKDKIVPNQSSRPGGDMRVASGEINLYIISTLPADASRVEAK